MKDIKALCDLLRIMVGNIFLDGLKAKNMKARGNAPGNVIQKICALKGRDSFFVLSRPFRAEIRFDAYSQGVALGYHVVALSARRI
jgi:hypothetical protein